MTPRDFHAYATRLAIEAGADPARAGERMSQAAQIYAVACEFGAGCSCGETAEDRARGIEEVDGG